MGALVKNLTAGLPEVKFRYIRYIGWSGNFFGSFSVSIDVAWGNADGPEFHSKNGAGQSVRNKPLREDV
jgi:hypothetical protein